MNSSSYSDYTLEAFVNGSLPSEQSRAIEDAIRSDQALLERIETLREHNQTFLQYYPPQGAWVEVERKLKASHNTKASFSRIRLAVAFGGALAVALFVLPFGKTLPTNDDGIRMKGLSGPSLEIYHIKSGAQIERLKERSTVDTGTTLQVVVRDGPELYVRVISIDGRHVVTRHYPNDGDKGFIEDDRFALPSTYILDDAPDFETFFLITSPNEFTETFSVEELDSLQSPEQLSDLIQSRCQACAVTRYTLLKESSQ